MNKQINASLLRIMRLLTTIYLFPQCKHRRTCWILDACYETLKVQTMFEQTALLSDNLKSFDRLFCKSQVARLITSTTHVDEINNPDEERSKDVEGLCTLLREYFRWMFKQVTVNQNSLNYSDVKHIVTKLAA